MGHVAFEALLDHLAGRRDPAVEAHVAACARCAAEAGRAGRLLAAGRRAVAAPVPSERLLARAARIFREAHAPREPSLLRLVLDTLRAPAPAVRGRARFLRYDGDVTVELEATPATRGLVLRGQLTPPDWCAEAELVAGRVRRRAPVSADGTFVLRDVPARTVELRLGSARITGLDL